MNTFRCFRTNSLFKQTVIAKLHVFTLTLGLLFITSLYGQTQTIEHTTGTVRFTLINNGVYGNGGGFSFMGNTRALFAGGFLAGTSSLQLAVNIPNWGAEGAIDFVNVSGYLPFTFDENFDQIAECVYEETSPNISFNPVGISVKQTSFSSADDDFVILALVVFNTTSETISNLYIGQFADWDVGTFTDNRGGYDQNREILYQFEDGGANDPNYYGIKALSGASGAGLYGMIIFQRFPSVFDIFNFLSNFNNPGPQPVTIKDDYYGIIGSGPFTLAAGDSVRVGFAWVAGTNLTDLRNNADAAQAKWDNLVVSVEEARTSNAPTQFTLKQNYPNPFNPSTTIQYTLPKKSSVTLKVFNILGNQIRTLVNQIQTQGTHTIVWDGKNGQGEIVPSGVYIFRIEVESFIQSKKMILMR
ncbi:MAG: FlgD immunoglobulin-like domain containing protein [bacterium]